MLNVQPSLKCPWSLSLVPIPEHTRKEMHISCDDNVFPSGHENSSSHVPEQPYLLAEPTFISATPINKPKQANFHRAKIEVTCV